MRRSKAAVAEKGPTESQVQGVRLEPIRVVRRELTRPDGTTLEVDVPVYPPFQLATRPGKRPVSRHAGDAGDEPKSSEGSG